jgi:hypothetical protein
MLPGTLEVVLHKLIHGIKLVLQLTQRRRGVRQQGVAAGNVLRSTTQHSTTSSQWHSSLAQ